MKIFPPRLHVLVSALALAALAACGGGGGDSVGGGDDNSPPAARVAITLDNAPQVTAQAFAAGSAGFVGDALGATGVQVDVRARPAGITTAWRVAAGVLRSAKPASVVVGIAFSETLQCTTSGTVTVSGDVASQDGFSVGDTLTISFAACVEPDARLDGQLALTLTEVNADATLLAATADARALRSTALGVTEQVDGALRLRLDETDGTTSRIEVDATRIDFDRIVGGAVSVSRTLFDYDYLGVLTLASGSTSETLAFVASGAFGTLGTVSFAVTTTTPLVTLDGEARPRGGVLVVTGASGTTVRATVGDSGVVRLDIDTDGDGSADELLQRSWDELDAEL